MSEHVPLWLAIAAPVVAVAGALLYVYLGRRHYGADADWWEVVRRSVLPQLNRIARRNGWGYAAYRLGRREYCGTFREDPEVVEAWLAASGFERMPLAAFKYSPDGKPEVGSWAWRHHRLADRQLHVHLFEDRRHVPPVERESQLFDGVTDTEIYAHVEYNAYHPLRAAAHYLGVRYFPVGPVVSGPDSVVDKPRAVIVQTDNYHSDS